MASNVDSSTLPVELPRGPHGLDRADVAARQRQRLIAAMVECVAARGFAATSVADVIAAAGVSRKTFYEQFVDKDAAMEAAYSACADALFTQLLAELASAEPDLPRAQVHRVVEAYLRFYAQSGSAVAVFMLQAAQSASANLRLDCRVRLAGLVREWYAATVSTDRPVADYAFTAAVGAADTLILDHVNRDGAASLLDCAAAVSDCFIKLLEL